ncbi:MAG: copper amine oxidase N-terminal domain-containing protein [Defluviitaleaceae bacterium]|nr:copper amine oxidase N-terminal domain-containing protein [Defluviitaleaceae bacterium]
MIKLVRSALAAALVLAIAAPLVVKAAPLPAEPAFVRMQASIVDLDDDGSQMTVRSAAGGQVVILNVNDNTFVVDAVSGMNTSLAERVNDAVSVYLSSATTHSEPPIADALAVIVNIPAGYTPPTFHIADHRPVTGGGGWLDTGRLELDNGEGFAWMLISPRVTEPIRMSTGIVASVSAVEEGSKILIWWHTDYDARNINTVRRMVVLTHGQVSVYPDWRTPETEEAGYILDISDAREVDGELWVPLRQVAEGLGYEVIWEETWAINVEVRLDGVGFWRDITQSVRVFPGLGPEPDARLFDNRTYVPISFLETYSGRAERVNDEIIFYLP